jgi:hypothetical protein
MRHRQSTRAAAMVEAAVVIPVMVSFLAVIGLMKNGYDRKVMMNQQTRSQVLDYASHNCKSQTITYSETSTGGGGSVATNGNTGAGDEYSSGGVAQVGSPSTSGIMAKAAVNYQSTSVGSTRAGIKGRGLALQVRGEKSTALCNEEPQDGDFRGILGYAKSKIGGLF